MEDKELLYVLVTADTARDLSERVTVYLKDGWQLQGGPIHAGGTQAYSFAQAVVPFIPVAPKALPKK